MLPSLEKFFSTRLVRRQRLAFLQEVRQNLEHYYVMFQLGRLRSFELGAWEYARKDSLWTDPIQVYFNRLDEYQAAWKDYKNFEIWYNEDLNRKNQANGRILHAKRELCQEKFSGLENVILAAVEEIEKLISLK